MSAAEASIPETRMTSNKTEPIPSIKDSILKVIARIRQTAQGRSTTELPTAEFSHALNSVGEIFVDLLLQRERKGPWWLGDDGQWLDCVIKSSGKRCSRNFVRGHSPDWEWFPQAASRLADPMTGPDHVVNVSIPALSLSTHVALEQKLRFGTKQDAFASSATYVKHLVAGLHYPLPCKKEFDVDSYCHDLLEATKTLIRKTKKDGRLAYSGSVPHVCFVSLSSSPHKIYVQERPGGLVTECDFVGFLPPTVDQVAFVADTAHRKIVKRAKVRLWLGLDSLLEECEPDEVDAAWGAAIAGLSSSIRNPKWAV